MFSLEKLKETQSYFQNKMEAGGGWNALFYSNHDQPRALSRFGNDTFYREESAKLLAITLFGLQGTTYIYQGEELGMREDGVGHEEALLILRQKSRDNARTPMQWDNTKHHGFSQGEPWLASNPDRISAENELKNKSSVFYTYQRLIQYRKQYDILRREATVFWSRLIRSCFCMRESLGKSVFWQPAISAASGVVLRCRRDMRRERFWSPITAEAAWSRRWS